MFFWQVKQLGTLEGAAAVASGYEPTLARALKVCYALLHGQPGRVAAVRRAGGPLPPRHPRAALHTDCRGRVQLAEVYTRGKATNLPGCRLRR